MISPYPIEIKLLQKDYRVTVQFDTGESFSYSCYYLRVSSPSAEKTPIDTISQTVTITAIEPVGNYAVRFIFDDGHQTGIYSWSLLYELGKANG